MPWLKLLHITGVILWCGTLLYLPALIASASGAPRAPVTSTAQVQVPRVLFTLVVTPAALVAIASGTAIFVFMGPLTLWLMAKLAVVALLVLAHAACGMLVLRAERGQGPLTLLCALVTILAAAAVLLVAWLVLRKPF